MLAALIVLYPSALTVRLENEIKNVTVNGGNGSYKGLFGQTASGSVIRNLTLSNCNISGYQAVGAVVGQNNGLIENVAVSGIVSGTSKYTGGIVGINEGIIKNAEVIPAALQGIIMRVLGRLMV